MTTLQSLSFIPACLCYFTDGWTGSKQLVSEPQLAVTAATRDYFQLHLLKACTSRNFLMRHWKLNLLFTVVVFFLV